MVTSFEKAFIALCLEGFLYGVYSGIFAIYLQRPPNSAGTGILFFALCLLYVLSAATFADDLVSNMLEKKRLAQVNNSPSQIESIDSQSLLIFRLTAIQIAVTGCSDFLAQCILIYRCWIVWGQNIRVVIIPSFLVIAYMATFLAVAGAPTIVQGEISMADWGFQIAQISFGLSMAVNTLVTGLIVFKILKVFLQIKPTSVEQALGTSGGGTKLRHVMFVIIESGMVLFAIQLVRLVLYNLSNSVSNIPYTFPIIFNQMFNGIAPTVILVRVSMKLSFDGNESFKEAAESLRFNNPPSDSTSTHQRIESLLHQDSDRNEDIYFGNPQSDPNAFQRMGSMLPKDSERNEDNSNPPCDPNTVALQRVGSSN